MLIPDPSSCPLRPFGRLLRILLVVAVTAYVLWRARPAAVLDALVHADLKWIALAVALVVVDRTLMAYRWIVLLCPIDRALRPPLSAVIRIFFVSTFAGTFLPTSIGADVVRAFGLSQLRVAPGQAVASVLMDRLLGVVSILIMGVVGLMLAQTQDLASIRSIEVPLLITAIVSAAAGAVVFNRVCRGHRGIDRASLAVCADSTACFRSDAGDACLRPPSRRTRKRLAGFAGRSSPSHHPGVLPRSRVGHRSAGAGVLRVRAVDSARHAPAGEHQRHRTESGGVRVVLRPSGRA